MSFNKAKSLKTASKYVQQGKYQSAIEEYRQMAQAEPSDVTTLNTLGDLYVKVGQTSEAIASFMHIAEHYRVSGFYLKAIAMLKKVSKLDAGNIAVSLKLAGLYAQQKLVVDARHQYLSVAEHYIREGQTQQALEIYQKIADLDPENTAVQMKLAEAYLREDQVSKAYDTFLITANELRRQNKEAEALQIYLRALKANPQGQVAIAAAVNLYLDHKEPQVAIELIEGLLADRPNDAELLTLLARIHQSAHNLESAETALEKMLATAPARYQYALDLARLYVRSTDVTGALRLFDRVVVSLYEHREEEKAALLLREIISIEPQHMGTLTRLAAVYEQTHDDHLLIDTLNTLADVALQKDDKPAAISALKRLLELEPDESQYRRRLQELEGTNPTGSEATFAPARGSDNEESVFDVAPAETDSDFSAYSIQVTEDSSNGFEVGKTDSEWSNWSISTADTPAESAQDFGFGQEAQAPAETNFFETALPSFGTTETIEVAANTAHSNLHDELESVDFYLSQGMLDVARYTLEAVAENFPDHPELKVKFAQLCEAETKTDRTVTAAEPQRETIVSAVPTNEQAAMTIEVPSVFAALPPEPASRGFSSQTDLERGVIGHHLQFNSPPETEAATIFMVPALPSPQVNQPVPAPADFEIRLPEIGLPAPPAKPPAAPSFDLLAGSEMGDLLDFLDEFKAETEQHKPGDDFETQYNLGLAYKEMEMFDEAIEEFQAAFKAVMADPLHPEYIPCCNMLGFCFAQKGLPRLAIVWLKKAIEAPGRGEEVYQALRYDLADAYAALGEFKDAYETFAQVYAIDVQYRSVKTRMQEIAAQLK